MSYIWNNAYYFLHIVKCYQQKQKKINNCWSKLELYNSYSVKTRAYFAVYMSFWVTHTKKHECFKL